MTTVVAAANFSTAYVRASRNFRSVSFGQVSATHLDNADVSVFPELKRSRSFIWTGYRDTLVYGQPRRLDNIPVDRDPQSVSVSQTL